MRVLSPGLLLSPHDVTGLYCTVLYRTVLYCCQDCMDEKKKSLLAEDSDKDSICSGLAQLAEVCSPAVDSLAGCKGREYADNLVAIHVNSMSGERQSTPFPV